MTVSWLNQMGLDDVYVLQGTSLADFTMRSSETRVPGLIAPPKTITAAELRERLASRPGTHVIDMGSSIQYRAGHLPGAHWAIRARLSASLGRLEAASDLVFTSSDGQLAQLAAQDASAMRTCEVLVLEGGTDAWRASGFPIETGEQRMLDAPEDVWYRPYDRREGVENSMRDYLSWEIELIEQIKREGVRYPEFPRG